jgi:hypothetical protein
VGQHSPSTQPSCFSLGLQQGKNIAFPHWALNISHDESVLIIKKLDPYLGHLSSGSRSTHNFDNDSMFDLRFHPAQALNIIRKIDFFFFYKRKHEKNEHLSSSKYNQENTFFCTTENMKTMNNYVNS